MTVLPFAANQPGIVPGIGFFSRAAITNKCTNYSGNPNGALLNMSKAGDAAATLTEVDDIAQLQLAGLYGADRPCTNGKVYKLDNSAGTTLAIARASGSTGNTNQHTSSVYVPGGSGGLGQFISGTERVVFPASSAYVRRTLTFIPADTGRSFNILADPGQIVYFILNQLVEGLQAGPIIVSAGAAAGVGADNLSTAVAAGGEDHVFIVAITFRSASDGANIERFFSINDGTNNNRMWCQRDASGSVSQGMIAAGVSQSTTGPNSGVVTTGRLVACLYRRDGRERAGFKLPNGTVTVTAGDPGASSWPTVTTLNVGHHLGVLQSKHLVEFIGLRKGTFTDADIIAILQAA